MYDSAQGSLNPKWFASALALASNVLSESKLIVSLSSPMIVDELSTVILLLLVTFNQFLLLGIAVKPPALESVFCLKSEEVFASSFTSLLACKVEFLISISLV